MHILDNVNQHSTPFEYFTCVQALPNSVIDNIIQLFDVERSWEVHDSFYKASIADVTDELESEFLQNLSVKMAELTGAELSGRVEVKIQKMESGQYSGVHTDRPLLGYEVARLIVQLNDDWSVDRDGGALRIHNEDNDESIHSEHAPRKNSCFGFVMTPEAHHSVQVTNRERRSVVFYFWHIGNTQEISDWVMGQLSSVNFADLPDYLSEKISLAEQHQSEEETFRAATVAWLLVQWGCDRECVTDGYQSALRCHTITSSKEEILASMVYALRHEAFDIEGWRFMRKMFLSSPSNNLTPSTQEAVRICLDCK